MKTILYAIGKTDDEYLNTGIGKYCQRIVRYTPFEFVALPDIRNSKNMSEAIQRGKEGELLDERGREMTSVALADWMSGVFAQGHKRLVFVIGGPYGFSDDVYNRANAKISLSKLTFPHQLVRLLFVEQLYRCHTILKGEPYHHI